MTTPKLQSFWNRWRHKTLGGLLFALAFGVTIFTASASGRDEPPSAEMNVVLVVLAGLLQLGSVALFSSSGKPDPSHAQASVRRLVALTIRTQDLSTSAEAAKDLPLNQMRSALTGLSARLNYIAQDTLASVEDWTSFNDSAKAKVEEMDKLAETDGFLTPPSERLDEDGQV